jgi:L-ribulokinase
VLLLDLRSGDEAALCELAYPHGVIADKLPEGGMRLPPDWALHDPADYMTVLEAGIREVLRVEPGAAPHVVGIGIDTTACTVLPATADGTPLCAEPAWRGRPHSWLKLWKHHSAQGLANRMNEVALDRGEEWLARYGGHISSEWYFPKLAEIWYEDREVYDAAERFLEVGDWVVWQLTGVEARAACAASYKALWAPGAGLPDSGYFEAVFPGFTGYRSRLGDTFHLPGASAGHLLPAVAERLGLPERTAVAVANVDSFVSFPGAGADGPGSYVMVVGTSTCSMVVGREQRGVPGMTGVAPDGILPGLYGYEAGQAAVGDMFGWFAKGLAPTSPAGTPYDLAALEAAAAQLEPGESGLLTLDWWNGNRSVLGDADLSGLIAGLTLTTGPAHIYRSLLEGVAFGNAAIVDAFVANGLPVTEIVACGGIADKSPLLMQLVSDASGLPVRVPASEQVPARGSALYGAVAAGEHRSGFAGIAEAARALSPATAQDYKPGAYAGAVYRELYGLWTELHDAAGRQHARVLHELKRLRAQAVKARADHTKEES